MAKTINVDVIDKSVALKNPVNICIVNKPNPAKNCTVTESQLYRLINMPSYWVYEAGTTNIITGKNFEKYFPSSSGGGTGDPTEAEKVSYDNTKSKIPSLNVQGAIDYLKENGGSGGGLTLGETNTTAYRGDRGKIAYNHSQLTTGNPHGVTKADIGLDKADNTADVDKPISTLQQVEFDKKLDTDKAVGKNVAGQEFTVAGKKVTAGKGSEVFNNYEENKATGEYSHAEGYSTIAAGKAQHVEGKFNIEDTENKFVHIIGNGTSEDARSNAFAIDWNGNIYVNNSPTGVNVNDLQAVSHTHTNKEIIDKLSVDESGKLLYDGNPISSGGVSITIDSELSETSKNPVENQAITSKILPLEMSSHMHTNKDILDKFSTDENTNELLFNDTPVIITITVDSTLSETSSNPIQNKTVTQQINQLNQRIPTKTSQLSNDKEFQTKDDIDTVLTPYAKTTDIPTVPSKISSFTNDKEYQTKSDVTTILTAYTKTSDLKTKLSQFENDENYIKNTVDNLVNYYTKTETYNKTEVDALIGGINKLTSEIVTELPTTDISTSTIYLVKKGETTTYTQWMYINGTWAELGDTTVDLSNYYTITEIDNKLLTYASLDIVNNHINDTSVHVSTDERTNWNRAVTDSHTHDNKNVIDKFTEDDNGGLLYNGEHINAEAVNVWHGTRTEFEAIPVKDENVTYIVEDEDDDIAAMFIDDTSVSQKKAWSSQKTQTEINNLIDDSTSDTTNKTWSAQKISNMIIPVYKIPFDQDIDFNSYKDTGYYTTGRTFSTGDFTHNILNAPTIGWLPVGGFALEVKNFADGWSTQILYAYVEFDDISTPVYMRTFFYKDQTSGSIYTQWTRIGGINDNTTSSNETWSSKKINEQILGQKYTTDTTRHICFRSLQSWGISSTDSKNVIKVTAVTADGSCNVSICTFQHGVTMICKTISEQGLSVTDTNIYGTIDYSANPSSLVTEYLCQIS